MLSHAEREQIAQELMVRKHSRPMPIDAVFRDARKIGGRGPVVPVGTQAQGAFGVFDVPHRDGLELVSYERAPWAVLRSDVRRMIQTAMLARFTAVVSDQLSVTDVGGVGRTMNLARPGDGGSMFIGNFGTAGDQLIMRWGSSNTAATGNDVALTTQVDSFVASAFSRDTTLFTDTLSGSKVYAGANTTAREIGFSEKYDDTGAVVRDVLFDHTVIADTPVNNGQTAAVSYVVQF